MFKKRIFAIFLILALFVPALGFSQTEITITNPLAYDTIIDLVNHIIGILFAISLALVPLMIVWGAFYILTAGGEPKKVETGRKIILYAVIGFAVLLLARGITYSIKWILGVP